MRIRINTRLNLFILLSILLLWPTSAQAQIGGSSFQLYPGGNESDGVAANQSTYNVFFDQTYTYANVGSVCLSSQKDQCSPPAIDDYVIIWVNGNKVVDQKSYTHDFGPIDFTPFLHDGDNQIRVQLIDLMGPTEGGSPLWLVQTGSGSSTSTGAGDTSKWKVLNNIACGFSLKYPAAYSISFGSGEGLALNESTTSGLYISDPPMNLINEDPGTPNIEIGCVPKTGMVNSVFSLAEVAAADYQSNQSNSNSHTTILEPLHEITFAGEPAYTFKMNSNGFSGKWQGEMGYVGPKSVVEVENNGMRFTIIYSLDPTLEKIMDTFTFSNPQESQGSNLSGGSAQNTPQALAQPTPASPEVVSPTAEPFAGIDISAPTQPGWCSIPLVGGLCKDFFVQAGDLYCSPQCMVTAEQNRPDIQLWVNLNAYSNSADVVASANNKPAFKLANTSAFYTVHIRTKTQKDPISGKDLIIWPQGCDKVTYSGGHIGYVESVRGNSIFITDSNWGPANADGTCSTRKSQELDLNDPNYNCLIFISSPELLFTPDLSQPNNESSSAQPNSQATDSCSQYSGARWLGCKLGWK